MEEIWKDIVNYEDSYKVSNLGRVISLPIKSIDKKNRKVRTEDKYLVTFNKMGYLAVTLYKNKKGIPKLLHRLIAEAFIPNPDNKPCINHKNGIKNDNKIENLEWCTNSENNKHAYDTGLKKKGSDHYMARKVIDTKTNITYECIDDTLKLVKYSKSYLISMLNGSRNNKTSLKYISCG